MLKVDWNAIRPLNGSQQKGFEELCAQLARFEIPTGLSLIRVGTPDGGVECYAILNDGNELGWQAKFFNAIEDSQWSQIDRSIKTALEKHPHLIKYYICVPWDRPDARRDTCKSAQDRWDEHVVKWTGWASERGMTVEFIYWGSSELIDRISRPEFISKYHFWFDARAFDIPWFTARLEEAVRAAGARYTPEIHVDLPINAEFEAFGRTQRFFDRIKSCAQDIRKTWNDYRNNSMPVDSSTTGLNSKLSAQVSEILIELGAIKSQPIGGLPFQRISDLIQSTKTVADELIQLLFEKELEYNARPKQIVEGVKYGFEKTTNPFKTPGIHLVFLVSALECAREQLDHGNSVAGHNLMILTGNAGTGKTHLLCDVARQRISNNQPTVLLMGQKFISYDAPWTQASQQLDLPGMSAEDFIGALESAAQVAGCRALVLVDALNEGAGRQIWPSHLATFISYFQRSPWIGVVLSIRSSYEDVIIPKEIHSHAALVTHRGFTEHEYDAIRIFFTHYNLELPSTPLLSPEFSNPLFLKILCEGLKEKGEHRLPRGFYGITAVFTLYLGAINERLSSSLGFNKKDPLVWRALETLAKEMFKTDDRWLPRDKAEELIDSLLPGREFERSLYRALVVEGVLTEEIVKMEGPINEEVTFINYERFSDHLIAKMLLDTHFNPKNPAAAFAAEGPLSYLCDEKRYVSQGLLEALCIQVPERVKEELITLAPRIIRVRRNIGDAFRQSIAWREITAFSKATIPSITKVDKHDHRWQNTLDILLTVATLPGHPLNANYLNKHLRKYSMPDRDASWSIYLHNSWEDKEGVVRRFVEWVSMADHPIVIDDESLDLYSMVLAWMFTTSNRFLRDHATKALVNVLSGKVDAAIRIIEMFSDVGDLYITERVYAVIYGIAMRSHDAVKVGILAQCVYDRIFASEEPPVHILLRDYARGVIERAIFLDSDIEIDPNRIRPPYKSTWPKIPTRKDIEPYLPDRDRGAWDGGDLWARNRIADSVLNDDFAFYVIGTNSSRESRHWLSLRLQDPIWHSPEERLSKLIDSHSPDERAAWKILQESNENFEKISRDLVTRGKHPPRFDLSYIQRYILWRVFDLGWTTERFGKFDRYTIGFHGRDAKKSERIGKKYQWIAYHEIMAFISDNFQYYESFNSDEIDHAYVGPWQIHARDIDPSCIARVTHNKPSKDEQSPVWWAPVRYDEWDAPLNPREWIACTDDIPNVKQLLSVTNPKDESHWLNLHGIFTWDQPTPADHRSYEIEQREIWYTITGFLIHKDDTDAFLDWAKDVDLLGYWIPQPSEERIFLGEYGWAPAYQYYQSEYFGNYGWTQLGSDCPIKVLVAASQYASGCNGFDCSQEENDSLKLPAIDIIKDLGIKWNGNAADYFDSSGNLVALDPTEESEDPVCLLIREDSMRKFLDQKDLTICWTIHGEKRVFGAHFSVIHPPLKIMGAYVLRENIFDGFINYKLEEKMDND